MSKRAAKTERTLNPCDAYESVQRFTEVYVESMVYRCLWRLETPEFPSCSAWGARITPLFSTQPFDDTPLRHCGRTLSVEIELLIFTRISLSMDTGVPPVSPQCVPNVRNDKAATPRRGPGRLVTRHARGLGLREKR